MALPRFFLQDLANDRLQLSGDEGRHAARVRRIQIGEEVSLFDGRGTEVIGRVTRVHRDMVELEVSQRSAIAPPASSVTLAVAMPQGPRAEWLIEKAAELNVAAVWPLRCERGVVVPGANRIDKWRRIAREANKQSGRHFIMEIATPLERPDLLSKRAGFDQIWLADPDGGPPPAVATRQPRSLVIIGPEGGFTEPERATILAAGARSVRLAANILRIETAAVAAAAIWAMEVRALP